jgi:hypothetical protein
MLIINPSRVMFAGKVWEGVAAAAIDHAAAAGDSGLLLGWGDAGPYAVFGDVAERKVTIKIEQVLTKTDVSSPRPGDLGELVLYASVESSEAGRVQIRAAACVVVRVVHELAGSKGPRRVVELAALSADGAADPVEVTAAEAES